MMPCVASSVSGCIVNCCVVFRAYSLSFKPFHVLNYTVQASFTDIQFTVIL